MLKLGRCSPWKIPSRHLNQPFPAKHRAWSFEFCLLILFLENLAVFSLYLQTVVPIVPVCFYALVAWIFNLNLSPPFKPTSLNNKYSGVYRYFYEYHQFNFNGRKLLIPLLRLIITFFFIGNIASNIKLGSTHENL